MGTNCAPLLADILLYPYEAEFLHAVFALNGKETASRFSLHHLQVHRWCIVHKQPRNRELSRLDVSCWTWDQGQHREHHFFFLPRFTLSIGRDGQIHTLPSITNEMISISTSLTLLWLFISQLINTMRPGLLLVWMFYSERQALFQ